MRMKLPCIIFCLAISAWADPVKEEKSTREIIQAVSGQATLATQAAEKAHTDAVIASEQAAQSASTNTSLLIVNSLGFLGIILGFVYKWLERKWDQKEILRREAVVEEHRVAAEKSASLREAKLDQIHTLVNSTLAMAKAGELRALELIMVLLPESIITKTQQGVAPSAETLELLEKTRARILELRAQLSESVRQTAAATLAYDQAVKDLQKVP